MRKGLRKEADFSETIERYAEHIIDLAAEERRLLKILTRVRVVKSAMVASLAKIASAAERR